MDASLLPVSLPARGSVVARTVTRVAPLLVVAGIAAAFAARSMGMGSMSAHGFAEAIPLNVAPSAAGRIAELVVSVGQPVKAGDPIMRLDSKPLTLQRQQTEAERSLLTAKLLAETSKVEDEVMRAEVWRLRTVAGSQQDGPPWPPSTRRSRASTACWPISWSRRLTSSRASASATPWQPGSTSSTRPRSRARPASTRGRRGSRPAARRWSSCALPPCARPWR